MEKVSASKKSQTALFLVLGTVALLGAFVAVYDLQRGIKQATSLYSVGVAGLSVEGDLQAYTQQSRRTLIYALTTSDPNEQIPFVNQTRIADKRVTQLHAALARILLDPETRAVLRQLENDWPKYQKVRDEIISLILEGRSKEALDLEQKDGTAHFETCAEELQKLKKYLDIYAQRQLSQVQQTYYRSAVEIGMLVLMALMFVVVLFKLTGLHQSNRLLGEAELCERERNLVLQMVSEDKPLPGVLAAVKSLVERQSASGTCVIRLISGKELITAAPARVRHYTMPARAQLQPPSCTCALAAANKSSAFTSRIDADPLWSGDGASVQALGDRSCLSVPIRSANHDVLGTIALFSQERECMDGGQFTLLERSARLAAVAIEQRNATDQLAFQAKHDALTGLPNRVGLMEVLKARATGSRQGHWAVIWIDLDHFKPVNDALGHQVGDMLLQAVAGRLQSCISKTDKAARIGGDEFVLVLDAVDADGARAVAGRAVRALSEPFAISSHRLLITASVGVSVPSQGATAEESLRNADLAMYQAKRAGKNSFRVFDPNLAEDASSRLAINQLLASALENGEMWLVYQPQVSAAGEIVGVEALLRWKNAVLGVVSPAEFIPVAEENGLINAIGAWVMRTACAQAVSWRAEGYALRMSVNISACQISRPDFVDEVADIVESTGIHPRFLEFELTETSMMRDVSASVEKMRRLRATGSRIAIDDFGTGNSSLSYLSSLPIDTLKIDRSFVAKIDAGGSPVIKAILTLARSMEIATVAEGVEFEHQTKMLRAEGCDLIQGYHFYKPMSPDALLSILRDHCVALAS